MDEKYYLYVHMHPITREVFYVGVGQKDRIIDGGAKRNKSWKKFVYNSGGFLFEFVKKNISKKEALQLERKYINEIGLHNLTNIVGEDGNSTAFKKGQTPWNKGLKGAQSCAYKKVKVNNIEYTSVDECVKKIGIGKTTFYRWVKRGLVDYV